MSGVGSRPRVTLELRPYQREAVDIGKSRRKILLALTMGAGKTAVALTTVREMREEDPSLQCVVFCTNSLKYQWRSEIDKWDPGASSVVIDGDKKKRRKQYVEAETVDYVMLSYDMLIHDWDLVREHLPYRDVIVADEVTMVKSFTAKRSKRLKFLAGRSEARIGLSGQPVENRPEELFSIMEFVDPEVLGSFPRFDRTFIDRDNWGKPVRYKNLDRLHGVLTEDGAMFRRSREDIAEFLPQRLETEIPIPLDPKSQSLYEYMVADLLRLIDEALESGTFATFNLAAHYGRESDEKANWLKGQIMSRMTAMRLLTGHPRLLRASAEDFDDEETHRGSSYASLLAEEGMLDALPDRSAKLDALLDMVDEIFSESMDQKVVVFSGFKPMLGLIGQALRDRKIGYTSMTGDTSAQKRHERITRFNTDPKCRLFLSSDAGAYGVNLDSGTHLINYDLPWSAGALAQRVARIDRTSSAHDKIQIMYLFTSGTVEERQYHMLSEKARIADAFVDGKGFDSKGGVLTLELGSLRAFMEGTSVSARS
jgi:SNF2 family DNA or RNA helicase